MYKEYFTNDLSFNLITFNSHTWLMTDPWTAVSSSLSRPSLLTTPSTYSSAPPSVEADVRSWWGLGGLAHTWLRSPRHRAPFMCRWGTRSSTPAARSSSQRQRATGTLRKAVWLLTWWGGGGTGSAIQSRNRGPHSQISFGASSSMPTPTDSAVMFTLNSISTLTLSQTPI
jgi:hypothetical protein